MATYPTPDQVLSDIGDDMLNHFTGAIMGARDDRRLHREEHPDWAATYSTRYEATFLHERIWGRMLPFASDAPHIGINESGPRREITLANQYMIRFKRLSKDDRISTFPTAGAINFWTNDAKPALPGMEAYSLAMGYYWDEDDVQCAAISLRRELNKQVWTVHLEFPQAGAETPRIVTPSPAIPEFDLTSLIGDDTAAAEGPTGS